MKRLAIAVAFALAGRCAFAIMGFRDCRAELPDDVYEAFVAAHGNDVHFLGMNMYLIGKMCHAARESCD